MGGPVRFGVGDANEGASETSRENLDFDFLAMADVEAAAYDLVENGLEGFGDRYRDVEEVTRWAGKGAFVVEQHPNHPDYLIAELETGRGCPYRCSFCTEPLYGDATFRPPGTVVDEVAALAERGVRHFRLGRQADILAYGGDGEKPNPDALRELYGGIREVAPELETLHLDNVNPITVVRWPDLAREGLGVIAEHNTPGDTAAFGLESADPVVQEENNLNVTADECFRAVEIVNEEGGWRPDGTDGPRRLPKLLPGINLVHGLQGEREETFEHNRRFLRRVYDAGLTLRRINIRQVMAFEGTEMADTGATIAHDHKEQFGRYKREELGWNTAVGNATMLVTTALTLIYQLELYLAPTSNEALVALFILGFGGLMLTLNFYHVWPKIVAFNISSAFTVYALVYVTMALTYGDVPINTNTLAAAGLFFVELQSIHPFQDGNGRVGRLLNLRLLKEAGLENVALTPLDKVIQARDDQYYDSLRATNQGSHYQVWLRYYADAIRRAYRRAIAMTDLTPLLEDLSHGCEREVMEWALRNGLEWFQRGDFPNENGYAPQTVTEALSSLRSRGLLDRKGQKRGTKYRVSEDLLDRLRAAEEG